MTQKKRQFQDVLRVVSSPGSVLYNDYLDGVNAIGHMDCPAPPWDTEGTYRLAAVSGSLVIQHLVEGSWETAPTEKPKGKAKGKSQCSTRLCFNKNSNSPLHGCCWLEQA